LATKDGEQQFLVGNGQDTFHEKVEEMNRFLNTDPDTNRPLEDIDSERH